MVVIFPYPSVGSVNNAGIVCAVVDGYGFGTGKTAESDKEVTQNFVKQHLEIGIETLMHIQNKNYSVKHLIF